MLPIVAAVALAAAGGTAPFGARWLKKRKNGTAATKPGRAPVTVTRVTPVEVVRIAEPAAETAEAATGGAVTELSRPPQDPDAVSAPPPGDGPVPLDILKEVAKQTGSAALSSAANVVTALDLSGKVTKLIGGNQAQEDASRAFGPGVTGAVWGGQQGAQLADDLGLEGRARDVVVNTARGLYATTASGGGVGGAALVLAGEAASAIFGAIAGKDAEDQARRVLSSWDPSRAGTFTNEKIARPVADFVNWLSGGPAREGDRPPGPPAAVSIEQQQQQVAQRREQREETAPSGLRGLLARREVVFDE